MRIIVYLPNLTKNTGGAEVYGLWLASALTQKHNVTVLTEQPADQGFDINKIFKKYNIDPIRTDYYRIPNLKINRYVFVIRRIRELAVSKYVSAHNCDLFINVTYGKLVLKGKCKKLHIIHFPAAKGKGIFGGFIDKRYVRSYDGFISNSEFTKNNLRKMYGVSSDVLIPPITMDMVPFSVMAEKEKIILAVDRIVPDKCLMEMVSAFKQIVDEEHEELRFVIVGNKDKKEVEYYNRIIESVKGYPIEIYTDVGYEDLVKWYKKALIFWHAKGYGVSDNDPFNMEHFGMTTVEAMKNGCIPIVVNKAGPKEVVSKLSEELLWDSLDELKNITVSVLDDDAKIQNLQKMVLQEADNYRIEYFKSKVVDIVERYI